MAKPLHGKTGDLVPPGGSLEITVDLHSNAELEDWVLNVGINESDSGRNVFETDTQRLGHFGEPVVGLRRTTLVVDEIHAGPGTYDIELSLKTLDGRIIHTFPSAASFTVVPDESYDGSIYGRPRFLDHGQVES